MDHAIPAPQRKSAAQKWNQNSTLISILFHVVLLIIFAFTVALIYAPKQEAVFEGEPPPRPKLQPRKLEMKVRVQQLQKRSARPKLQPRLASMSPSDIAVPEIKKKPKKVKKKVKRNFSVVGASGRGLGIGGGNGLGLGGGAGGLGLPPAMASRCSPSGRLARLQKSGGKAESEKAVLQGLRFLQGTQNGDGSWGKAYKAGMTGLALLAYLGHCETPDSPEFGTTVRKAIDFLVQLGESKGKLSLTGGHSWAYEHGIAAYALGEAYTLTGEDPIEPVFIKAIETIVYGQGSDGGWMYGYSKETPSDTSVSGWQVQALKSAYLTGLAITDVEESMDKSVGNMKRVCRDGQFGYRNAGDRRNQLNGAGVLCLQVWKQGSSSEAKDGLKNILDRMDVFEYKGGQANLYAWYYDTQAAFQRGGVTWTRYNRVFQNEILGAQAGDGSWPPCGGAGGHGNAINYKNGAGGSDASVYRTALNILMLEVYYRYLPSSG